MQTLNPAILITHGSDTLAWHCFHGGGGVAVHVTFCPQRPIMKYMLFKIQVEA